MAQIIIYRRRTMILPVSLGYDVSNDTITSEIREDKNSESELIAAWMVTFATDGTDGEIILTLDDAVTENITKSTGYMDLKRVSGGEPLPVFDDPLEVLIKDPVTN